MPENTVTKNGVLNIDKPAGMTSHDVVQQVRQRVGIRQVGHTGTLDPFATGVLLVAIGSATRLVEYTKALPKTYEATLTLGATSDTDDSAGTISPAAAGPRRGGGNQFSMSQIKKTLQQFVGTIQQIPPIYAAIKVKGKKLYEYARAGEDVERKPRTVTIYRIEVLAYEYPQLELRVACSSGTYIRSLARDVGKELGTGAYLSALRRTAIGPFELSTASPLEALSPTTWQQYVLPPESLVAHLPAVTLKEASVGHLRQGKTVIVETTLPATTPAALFDRSQHLIGIGRYDQEEGRLSPAKIL